MYSRPIHAFPALLNQEQLYGEMQRKQIANTPNQTRSKYENTQVASLPELRWRSLPSRSEKYPPEPSHMLPQPIRITNTPVIPTSFHLILLIQARTVFFIPYTPNYQYIPYPFLKEEAGVGIEREKAKMDKVPSGANVLDNQILKIGRATKARYLKSGWKLIGEEQDSLTQRIQW